MSDRVLPPGLSVGQADAALAAFASVVGQRYVLTSDDDLLAYHDLYPLNDEQVHAPSAVVAPGSVEEVQAVLRVANEHRVPLWPISRGKNIGYGGAAPRLRGTAVLDLGRMNKIIEVNERYGYCIVEPGVGFFDLYDHLQANHIPLWMAVPGNAWGSVMGNALDRGNSAFPYGDHASKICGLEVVLPDGSLIRTGMGAMSDNPTWPLFKYGFGPTWDQLFTQSNLGVVTKLCLWLMPEPEATLSMTVQLPNDEDVVWAVDELFALKSSGVLQQNPAVSGYLLAAGMRTDRQQWYQGPGAMPPDAIEAMLKGLGLGRWNVTLRLYGFEEVNAINARKVQEAFARHTSQTFTTKAWRRGDPIEGSGAGIPSVLPLQSADWRGGCGAHVTFSPVLPPDGALALAHSKRGQAMSAQYGLDYFGAFTMGERHMIATNGIIYDCADAAMSAQAKALFKALLADAIGHRYSEYRTHISFMDDVAAGLDFGGGAMARLNEAVKNALDPNGIIAPGKQGVWPKAYKGMAT
jgi:4-cresol dehydrogenase (hydroxylating)